MPELLSIILIIVFGVHLLVFLRLYHQRKQKHFFIFSVVFFFLVLSYAMRMWFPQLSLYGYTASAWLRVTAWVATAFAVIILMRHKLKN